MTFPIGTPTLAPGVRLTGLRPEMLVALQAASWIFAGEGVEVVITSACRAALDLRTRHLPNLAAKYRVAEYLQAAIGRDFDVVLKSPGRQTEHLHVEWQPEQS